MQVNSVYLFTFVWLMAECDEWWTCAFQNESRIRIQIRMSHKIIGFWICKKTVGIWSHSHSDMNSVTSLETATLRVYLNLNFKVSGTNHSVCTTTVNIARHTNPGVVTGFDDALKFGGNFEHKILVEARFDWTERRQWWKVVDCIWMTRTHNEILYAQ